MRKDSSQNDRWAFSFMLTLNNPIDYGYTHDNIKKIIHANFLHLLFYCMSDEIAETGTYHTHLYILMSKKKRWSAVKNAFKHAHIEPEVFGSPQQVVNYIKKEGEHISLNKRETSIEGTYEEWGSIPHINTGFSKNELLNKAEIMLNEGYKPEEIMEQSILFRQFEREIKKAFFRYKFKNVPVIRDIRIYWHIGDSGTGKSYTYVQLCEKYGSDDVFLANDYSCNGTALFSHYQAESVVVLDEYKGGLPYSMILSLLQGYRSQIHCRYNNVFALYTELHITSILIPQEVFNATVSASNRERDPVKQLLRRINYIVYHYIENGEYKTFELPMSEYRSYEDLKRKAHGTIEAESKFESISDSDIPFQN